MKLSLIACLGTLALVGCSSSSDDTDTASQSALAFDGDRVTGTIVAENLPPFPLPDASSLPAPRYITVDVSIEEHKMGGLEPSCAPFTSPSRYAWGHATAINGLFPVNFDTRFSPEEDHHCLRGYMISGLAYSYMEPGPGKLVGYLVGGCLPEAGAIHCNVTLKGHPVEPSAPVAAEPSAS